MKGTVKYGPDVAVAPEDPAPQILVTGPQCLAEAGDGCPGPAAVHQIHSALLEINRLALQPVLKLAEEAVEMFRA